MTITIVTEGRRHYLAGNTYPHRDAIRAGGGKWDAASKRWWTGKAEAAQAILAAISGGEQQQPAAAEDPMRRPLAGRCKRDGKSYYIAGRIVRGRTAYDDGVAAVESRDGSRVMLVRRDGKTFWAARTDLSEVQLYRRPQSLIRLRDYAEQCRKGTARHQIMEEIEALDDQDNFAAAAALAARHGIPY